MRTFKKFLTDGLILTATSLLLRWVGVAFNTFISNKLGSEGMGVYSLVQSVFGFAVTFSCSGINLGATRLISEAIARNNGREIIDSVKRCTIYSLFFSLTAACIVGTCANYIGSILLGDVRTVKAVRLLAVSLPFISLSSVFNGYFSAVRRVYKSATVMIVEELVQVTVTVKILSLFSLRGVEYACLAVAAGTVISEILSLLYNLILWLFDVRRHRIENGKHSDVLTKKLLGISLPLALSSYIRSGLLTVEHLLIPYGLRKNGSGYSQAMSTYGLIHGMVFPIIMFPSCLIYSFSGLLVPELAAYKEKKQYDKINKAVSKVLRYALLFSIGAAGIMICFSYELSMLIYNSSEAYGYIKLFAPLITVMYLDGAVDGILKGLNEQLHSMKINIADAFLSVLLVYFLIPIFGVKGYVAAIFVCEIFNCGMSLIRLVQICRPELNVLLVLVKPILCIITAVWGSTSFFEIIGATEINSVMNFTLRITITLVLYLFFYFMPFFKSKSFFQPKESNSGSKNLS